jgi:hypothetical protein
MAAVKITAAAINMTADMPSARKAMPSGGGSPPSA